MSDNEVWRSLIDTTEFAEAKLDGTKHVRMALTGPSGAGKTLTALKIAAVLGTKVAVIDTEDESAELFVNSVGVPKPYYVKPLKKFQVDNYIALMNIAAEKGHDVCIVDSLTPSWKKKNGILESVGRDIRNWDTIGNPQYDALMDCIKSFRTRMHIICTLRSDMEYALEPDPATGKLRVRKMGMRSEHRKDTPYEFDLFGSLDQYHNLTFTEADGKQRCEALEGKTFEKPWAELGLIIKAWLSGKDT